MNSPAPLLPPDTDDADHRVNPLLAVVIGMAFMFGTLALLLAFG